MKVSALTGKHNYFEDFKVGEVLKHARGKTVEPLEQVWITNVTMNTAEGHFNEHLMQSSPWGKRLGFGGVTISMCIGLAAQDTAENALMELGLDKIRLKVPVHHGDTLYCYSEVLDKEDAQQPDAGIVRFRHYGVNQDDKHVFEGERIVLIKRRSLWFLLWTKAVDFHLYGIRPRRPLVGHQDFIAAAKLPESPSHRL